MIDDTGAISLEMSEDGNWQQVSNNIVLEGDGFVVSRRTTKYDKPYYIFSYYTNMEVSNILRGKCKGPYGAYSKQEMIEALHVLKNADIDIGLEAEMWLTND